jgi:hypothetical protein
MSAIGRRSPSKPDSWVRAFMVIPLVVTAILLAFVIVISLTGCAALAPETRVEETAFQVIHAVDTAQTIDIRRHPGLHECAGPMGAAWAIGEHPKDHQVYEFMAAEGLLHLAITEALSRSSLPRGWVRAWELVTIGIDSGVVAHNFSLGLKVRL